ncbi:MAG: Hsp20/alpha crystallin family protein [Halobacteriaceae archaeon]
MAQLDHSGRADLARRYQYTDRTVYALDLGVPDEAVAVDVVDGTAIVVVEEEGAVTEDEFELPDGDAGVYMNNGVLTVEVKR